MTDTASLPQPTIPVHPQPGFYETTKVKVGNKTITHREFEKIGSRPKWSQEEAERRIFGPTIKANRKAKRRGPLPKEKAPE